MSRVLFSIAAFMIVQVYALNIRASDIKLPKNVEEILTCIPADTETVIVYRPKNDGDNVKSDALVPKSLTAWTKLARGPADFLDKQFLDLYQDAPVSVMVSAARHFRAPSGIGPMRYEGCHIVQFVKSEQSRFRQLKDWLRAHYQTQMVAEQECFLASAKVEADNWDLFVTFLNDDTLVVATDVSFLHDFLKRRAGPRNVVAFPHDLPQWQHIDLARSYWGIRRFVAAQQGDDSKVTAEQLTAAVGIRDSEAVGIVFSFDPSASIAPEVSYLSHNKDLASLCQRNLNQRVQRFTVEGLPNELQVLHLSFRTSSQDEVPTSILMIQTLLGHSVLF